MSARRIYCQGCLHECQHHAGGLCFYCYHYGYTGRRYKGPTSIKLPAHHAAERERRLQVYQGQVGEGGLMHGGRLDFLAAQRLP